MLQIAVLGDFRVQVNGRDIPASAWRRRKSAAILKILALAPGHRMHREQLMELLWPELDPDQAANSLYQALHSARRALDTDEVLVLRDQIVQLNQDIPVLVDVIAFEEAAAEARKSGRRAAYQAALDLYTGDLLPDDRYEPWAMDRRETLRDEYVSLVLDLAEMQAEAGDHAEAITILRQIVSSDPLHEAAHRALMLAYARSGQRQHALRQYQTLLEILARELDVDPEPETRALVERIRSGDIVSTGPDHPTVVESGSRAQRHNLPAPVSSFIGRAREKAELRRLLESSRLLTLTGSGGSGKSRLALEVAGDVLDEYPDGVWLVELAALSEPDLIPQEVAAALEIREAPSQPVLDTIRLWLKTRHLLLVLDNCEHLIVACARIAETLLRGSPGLRVLATSREPLRLDGEVTWLVPSLSLPDPQRDSDPEQLLHYEAVQLFVDRASSTSPNFALTAENAASVAQLCYRLDGIPLAIELAAARVRALTAGQIVERLSDRFQLLGGGNRAALSRQQTLRAALDWSHDLLSEPERVLFARLSVFSGGFSLEAAEAVCAMQPLHSSDVVDLLTQLVDRSLVVAGEEPGAPRYWLLETMREYARERLVERGEESMLRRCHAAHYTAHAIQADRLLRGGRYREGYLRFNSEHDNLRAALDWYLEGDAADEIDRGLELAGSLHWFWHLGGHFSEGRTWLDRMLAASAGEPSRGLAYAHTAAGILTLAIGEYGPARVLMNDGITLWRKLDEPDGLALGLTWSGWVELFHLDVPSARSRHEEGLAIFTELENDWGIAMAMLGLGFDAAETGDHPKAKAFFERALALYDGLDDEWGISTALQQLAHLTYRMGDFEVARERAMEVLTIVQHMGDRWLQVQSQSLLGEIARVQGDYETAVAAFDVAIGIAREIGQVVSLAWALRDAGFISLAQGDVDGARTLFLESLDLFRARSYQLGMICILVGMGGVASAGGSHAVAARLLGATQALLERNEMMLAPADRIEAKRIEGAARAALGDAAFDAAWRSGRELSLDEAIAEIDTILLPSPPAPETS